LLGETYGESDWRELRKKIGRVSSSVRQMMADEEPALETVASGKYAMIGFWGRVTRTEKAQALKLRGRLSAAIWLRVRGACCRKANGSVC
jgi:iron complex transport system ATP-binding protein